MTLGLNSNIRPNINPAMTPQAQIQAAQNAQLNQLGQLGQLGQTAQMSAQNTYPNSAQGGIKQDVNQTQKPLSNIPIQQDTLSLSTNAKAPEISTGDNVLDETLKSALNSIDTSMNAQMPSPEIKNSKEAPNTTLENNQESNTYKELPHLNVGVVDGPQNYSKTPVTDSLNKKAAQTPKTKLPAATNKKSFNAGSLSNLCALGAFGIVSVLFLPKGISKILKLIKHK